MLTERLSVYGLFNLRSVTERELQLAVTAQHHERVSDHTSLAWEKIKIRSTVPTECISLSQHRKSNHCKLGPSVFDTG